MFKTLKMAAMLATTTLLASTAAMAGKSDDTLRWASRSSVTTMDPYYNTNNEAFYDNGWLVWDTLIFQDPNTGEYKPLLAKSWKWLDNVTLDLVLRDDVKWHDGQPFTADDVVYTINYITDTKNKISQPGTTSWMTGAEKVNAHEVKIHLKTPFATAQQFLSKMILMLPKDFFGPNGVAGANGRLVGTGPYKVTKFVPSDTIELTLTRSYFANSPKGQPTIGKIVYRSIPDATTQLAELMGGRLDWVWNITEDQYNQLAQAPNLQVKSTETQRISMLIPNVGNKDPNNPMLKQEVREAIAHAIDVPSLTTKVIGTGATSLTTPCYPKFIGCAGDGAHSVTYDPALAKSLLAKAGYPNGLTLRVLATNQRPQEWTLALTGYLNQIGIKTDVEFLEFTALRQRLLDNKVDLYSGTFSNMSMQDVDPLWGRFLGGTSDDLIKDAVLTKMIIDAGAELDNAKRLKQYRAVQARIMDSYYWLPLYTTPARFAFTKDLNWNPTYDEITRFFTAKWK